MNLKLILRQQFSLPHRLPSQRPSRSRSNLAPARPSPKSFVLRPKTPSLQHRHSSSNSRDSSKLKLTKQKSSKKPKFSKRMGSQLYAQQLTLQVRNTEPLRKPRLHGPATQPLTGMIRIAPEEPAPRAPKIKASKRL